MQIERLVRRHLEAALFKGRTLVLHDPRQVGKTTLFNSILAAHPEKSAYVHCDLPEVQKLSGEPTLEDLRRFVADHRLMVPDEAQRIESIGLSLKILHEHFPNTQFLVTGSSSFELGKSVKEPLTGRKREFLLYPIPPTELAGQPKLIALRELLPRLLRFGSHPEAFTSADSAQVSQSIAGDYLVCDILELENLSP